MNRRFSQRIVYKNKPSCAVFFSALSLVLLSALLISCNGRGETGTYTDTGSAQTTEAAVTTSAEEEKQDENALHYEDFGAVGDGKTDDFDAIIATHAKANETGASVYAKSGAVYYIGPGDKRAVIKTDTDWRGATFIIDDTAAENCKREVFIIHRAEGSYKIEGVTSLRAGQTNLGVTLPADSIVKVVNANKKQYIRYGSNANSGSSQSEILRVGSDGTISPDTPVMWDYDTVTAVTGYKTDDKPLTLRGGTVITIANKEPSTYNYYYRGIKVYRSNVTIDGLTHLIQGEGSTGAPYYGIIIINSCSDVTVKNCVFTAHKTYKDTATSKTDMGSYDITADSCTDISIINCTQTTDITDSSFWGLFASNFARNLLFDGVEFSRFDAHQGVMNVTLRNSTFGHQGINLIGKGTALIENTTVKSTYFINLRSDYGSTWDGDIIIRNCEFRPTTLGSLATVTLINASNPETHDFGYTCYMPHTLTIEGLTIADKAADYGGRLYLFANYNSKHTSASYSASYPVVPTTKVTLSGIKTDSGYDFKVCKNAYLFSGTVVENK